MGLLLKLGVHRLMYFKKFILFGFVISVLPISQYCSLYNNMLWSNESNTFEGSKNIFNGIKPK